MSVVSNKDGNAESESYETLCFSAKILALDNVRLTIVTFEIQNLKDLRVIIHPFPCSNNDSMFTFNFPNTF